MMDEWVDKEWMDTSMDEWKDKLLARLQDS